MSYYQLPPDIVEVFRDMAARVAALENASGPGGRQLAAVPDEATIPAEPPSPVSLGGPAVTLDVPAGSFVTVFAEARLYHAADGGKDTVYLYEATDIPAGEALLVGGTPDYPRLTMTSLYAGHPTPGRRTYELRYRSGISPGKVKDRKLWVTVQ